MASFNKPSELNLQGGDLVQNFKVFKQEVEIYFTATQTEKTKVEVQVARLLNLVGKDGLRVYNTFEKDENETVESILKKQYQELSDEVKRMWNLEKVVTIPIVLSSTATRQTYENTRVGKDGIPTYAEILKFIQERVATSELMSQAPGHTSVKTYPHESKSQPVKRAMVAILFKDRANASSGNTCPCCGKAHRIIACNVFHNNRYGHHLFRPNLPVPIAVPNVPRGRQITSRSIAISTCFLPIT
ncbi:hypothetical protein M8J77_021810 [Diaphorina citri]|nr:hypothetical protein M8J77_021810 [Diaphorina citri]